MTSPYLHMRLRSLDEARQDRLLKELRQRHKMNELANKKARLGRTDNTGNVYRLGPRLITKLGAES